MLCRLNPGQSHAHAKGSGQSHAHCAHVAALIPSLFISRAQEKFFLRARNKKESAQGLDHNGIKWAHITHAHAKGCRARL